MAGFQSLIVLVAVLTFGDAARTSAQKVARMWLHKHADQDPDAAGLSELKSTNPEAFAIVQALMAKKSLGLLNPMHPTNALGQESSHVSVSSAAQSSEPAEAEAPVPHRNWLTWKPVDSAADEATVKNVMGSVQDLVGSSEPKVGGTDGSLLSRQGTTSSVAEVVAAASDKLSFSSAVNAGEQNSMASAPIQQQQLSLSKLPSFDWGNPFAGSSSRRPAAVAARPAPPTSMIHENTYLKGIDFSTDLPAAATPLAGMNQENSYLKTVNFGSASKKVTPKTDGPNALAGFSWFDVSGKSSFLSGSAVAMVQKEQTAEPNKYLNELRR